MHSIPIHHQIPQSVPMKLPLNPHHVRTSPAFKMARNMANFTASVSCAIHGIFWMLFMGVEWVLGGVFDGG